MSSENYIKKKMMPPKWCPGCGLHVLLNLTAQALNELNLKNTVVVSGIGCAGRGASYFNLDTLHGIHGRTIPQAVGIKTINPKLNVIIFSGDGDVLGIGGNHLIHAARRNDNITVIYYNNEVYAMTGGQLAPTTRLNGVTASTPYGNLIQPINTQGILMSNKNYFYARTSTIYPEHLKKCIKQAMKHKGFSVVECIFPCIVNYATKFIGLKTLPEIIADTKKRYKINDKTKCLKDNELGIVKK